MGIVLSLLNVTALGGWTASLGALAVQPFDAGLEEWHLKLILVCELIAASEVLQILFGMLRGRLALGLVLHYTRLLILLVAMPAAPAAPATKLVLYSWCVTEVFRYPMVLMPKSKPLRALRYIVPVFTFPLGVAAEAYLAYTVFPGLTGPLYAMMAGVAPVNILGGLAAFPGVISKAMNPHKESGKSAAPKVLGGCEFPEDGMGGRSTSEAGKKAIVASLAGTGTPEGKEASERCAKVKNWRFGYNRQLVELVKVGCKTPEAGKGSAEAGLKWMYENMRFYPKEGEPGPFGATVDKEKGSFHTGTIKGKASAKDVKYSVPYDGGWHPSRPNAPKGTPLQGQAFKDQAKKWVKKGMIEQDAADALCWTSDYFADGGDLCDVYVVMIGAGSAMGPFPKLMEMGATVVAIDVPGSWGKGGKRPTSAVWKRLCETAKSSPGSIVFPLSKSQAECAGDADLHECAGCDLMKQPGEIANWLCEWQKTLPSSAKVMIGNYTYLDGELHVKLALCADYCIQRLRKARPSTGVAFLCTPTDIHVRTDASEAASKGNYSILGSMGLEMLFNICSRGKRLVKNFGLSAQTADGRRIKLVDGLSVAQGPNYALAKRMQHWRAQVEFEAGATVSTMVAPSTATISVLHNRSFAWAYGGMGWFHFEIFKQETTNAVMSAMLLHDSLNTKGPKNPANRKEYGVLNSLELFRTQSVHGGLWRSQYKVDTIGEFSVLVYFTRVALPYLIAGGLAGAGALIQYNKKKA